MVIVGSTSVLYAVTLDKVKIPRSHPGQVGRAPGRILLHVTFSEPDNFHKEPLTFEVVDSRAHTMLCSKGHAL